MIYKNKTQSQNCSLIKQIEPSLLSLFSNYDKRKQKKKAALYFRILLKKEKKIKRMKHHKNKIIQIQKIEMEQGNVLFSPEVKKSHNLLIKTRTEDQRQLFEYKFYENCKSLSSKSRRVVGYSFHGDIFARHS